MREFVEKVLSLAILGLLSPLLLLVAALLLARNGRPVFFLQRRIGLHGHAFTMYKFRTMVRGAEKLHSTEIQKELHKSGSFLVSNSDDRRVTRTGWLLRRTSIDELPQLLNVIRGEMSLVGPRPMLPEETEFLEPSDLERFEVLPGITGWSQVNGRGALGSKAYIEHDLYFVRNFSWRLYMRIILLTPLAIFTGRGAS